MPPALPGQRIGLMGGSFNPPHEGHVAVALTAIRRLRLDRLWWLVSPGNPLKSKAGLAPLAERIEACRRLARDPRIAVTSLEAALGSPYTAATVGFLKARHPGVRFALVIGADNLAGFHRWRDWRDIATSVPIAAVDRPGWRLRAAASRFAHVYEAARIPEARAASLLSRRPPAWTVLSTRLSQQSSTALRPAVPKGSKRSRD